MNDFSIQKKQLLLLLAIVFLIVYRAPELLLYPRLWAEEGSVYLRYAYHNHRLDSLFFVPKYSIGYLALSVNIPTTLAAHLFPLEYAPIITTYCSLLIALLPIIIIIYSHSYIWDNFFKKILACLLIVGLPIGETVGEMWLNSINAQIFCGLIALCLLFEKLHQINIKKAWFYRILLLFCGLSGPYTAFLTFAFALKASYERSKESLWQFMIVALTASIQFTIFLAVKQFGLLDKVRLDFFNFSDAIDYIGYYFMLAPIMGRAIERPELNIVVSTLSILIVLYVFTRKMHKGYQLLLIVTFLSLAALTTYGALRGIPQGRYQYLPAISFLFLLLANIHSTRRIQSLLASVLIVSSLGLGVLQYTQKYVYLQYDDDSAYWPQEIQRWRQDPDYEVNIWPKEWQFYLSSRAPLIKHFNRQFDNTEINLISCCHNTVEDTITFKQQLPPVRFTLHFDLKVQGDIHPFIFKTLLGKWSYVFTERSLKGHSSKIAIWPHQWHRAGSRADIHAVTFQLTTHAQTPVQLKIHSINMRETEQGLFRLSEWLKQIEKH